jgi:hypothetical protein
MFDMANAFSASSGQATRSLIAPCELTRHGKCETFDQASGNPGAGRVPASGTELAFLPAPIHGMTRRSSPFRLAEETFFLLLADS